MKPHAIVLLIIFAPAALAAGELEEVRRLLPKFGSDAKAEFALWDGTRVDILTDEYAIEADWAKPGKHFEAIGQALYYAEVAGRKPGILLLVTDMKSQSRFVYRTAVVCASHDIRLWVERVDDSVPVGATSGDRLNGSFADSKSGSNLPEGHAFLEKNLDFDGLLHRERPKRFRVGASVESRALLGRHFDCLR